MTERKTYENGYQRRAVEALLDEGMMVRTDNNSEIHVRGTADQDISAMWADIAPYEIRYVRGMDDDPFSFMATLGANWDDVDFDNEPYQEDNNE